MKSLIARNIHKKFNDRVVLDSVTLAVNPNDAIGLVGKNGSGKTTLLKILAGIDRADSGIIERGGLVVGYLPQNATLAEENTIYEAVTEGVRETRDALKRFEMMNENFDSNNETFMEEYGRIQTILDSSDGYSLPNRAETIVRQLGVTRELTSPVSFLSGGETVRLSLAKLLLQNLDILLLDEPTNHLDLSGKVWLEQFLKNWKGGLIIVSHDRDFLDVITTTTLELENGTLRTFGGNFSFYREQKQIEREAREREVVRLAKEVKKKKQQVIHEQERVAHSARRDIARNPEDHDRYRANYFRERATRTAGDKKKLAQDKVEETKGQLEAVKFKKRATIKPSFIETESHEGKQLVSMEHLSCGYEGRVLLKDVALKVLFGNRIVLFGNNGSGKTTLIKGMCGDPSVTASGTLKRAERLTIQVLDQRYAVVDHRKTVLENVKSTTPNLTEADQRDYLARFLFRETSDVNKPANVLSGGEIARLAVAMITASAIDLLVLDEPTNNLDISAIEEMEIALHEFPGAILVVSHDLSFLRNIAVHKSYVIHEQQLRRLHTNPSDGEEFKEELMRYLVNSKPLSNPSF